MTDWKLPREGGCRCGRVRIRVEAPPLLTMACHCVGCQRMSASAFSLSAAIPADGFRVTKGEPVIGGLHGTPRHFFCGFCMTWLFTRPEDIDVFVNLRPTMLDDPIGFATPFIETYTGERQSWASTPAIHSFETVPPFEDYEKLVGDFTERAALSS
jgi:hypothetical protein